MKSLLGILATLGVIALGYWAYSENYATQSAMKERRELEREIADAQDKLHILEDEWAYLNRPDRLKQLVEMNYDRLALIPMSPDSFGRFDQVSFPKDPFELDALPPVDGVVTVSSDAAEGQP